jgi:hypothetical protein
VSRDGLLVGVARRSIDPAPGAPGPGLRLWHETFTHSESELTLAALGAASGEERAVVVAADVLWFDVPSPARCARTDEDDLSGHRGDDPRR